jgi:ABC-type sugar transport system ATPase subunit
MAKVELAGVRKQFGRVTALDRVDLVVEDRSFTCLVGPSGSGKSTLLNLIAGFEAPTAGHIYIDGQDMAGRAPGARDIAMVFQSYALYPHMTVYDNMAFGLEVRKTPRQVIRERVAEAAELLRITELLDRKPRQLSGGQRQRVAVGRAITRHPKVFLLDEPLSNLDAQLRLQTRVELKLLFERIGGTVIYVTHDQAEAMTLADQVVVLHQGQVQQVGRPLDVYDAPRTSFVAGFLGSPAMNLLPAARRTDERGIPVLEAGGLVVRLAAAFDMPNDGVLVGFRPEAVVIGPAGRHPVPAVLQLVERLGSQDVIYVSMGGSRVAVVAPSRSVDLPADGRLSLRIDPTAIHLFDPRSGRRLNTPAPEPVALVSAAGAERP